MLTDNKSKRTQGPHTDVIPDKILGKEILIGFMTLLLSGLFLEVLETHKYGKKLVKGDIVFIAYGQILIIIMDSSVVHAGEIVYSDETNLRMQFAFSNSALHAEHTQIKGSVEKEYCFNTTERINLSNVCEKFSIYN